MKTSELLVTYTHPDPPFATLFLAHGAGGPMDSDWMNSLTHLLVQRRIRVVRFEFPYMARWRKEGVRPPPNPQPVLLECWREAVNAWEDTSTPIAIGGKSMGGRMASMLADELDIRCLVCLGYPLHAAGKPANPARLNFLESLSRPTLLLQGERDTMGSFAELSSCSLPSSIQTYCIPSGDHSFKPLVRSGRTLEQNLELAAETTASFIREHL